MDQNIEKDFFLSHASEDKALVREVNEALINDGFSCWFDEAEILPGDSLIDKVFSEGLKKSQFVILFISSKFLSKEWPQIELETVIARQIRTKEKRIIPYLIDVSFSQLVDKYPFFESIFCGNFKNTTTVVSELERKINRDVRKVSSNNIDTKLTTEDFDFSKIRKYPAIQEVSLISKTFKIYYYRAPQDFQIQIIQMDSNFYYGLSNYSFWGPDQASPYQSMHPQSNELEALNDALDGIKAFDSSEYPDELVFWVSENNEIYDGCGNKVTLEEAYRRRDENHQKFQRIPWTQTTMNGGPWWFISKNFSNKKFSIIGPIDDDTEYVHRIYSIQKKGIDFRGETVPIRVKTKDELIHFFEENYGLEFIDNELLYSQAEKE